MFGLAARFELLEEKVGDFDRMTAEVIDAVSTLEPRTLVYAAHEVEGRPTERLFYEVYEDRAGFEFHEAQEHTRRFLAAREECFAAPPEVDFLTLTLDKGITSEGR